MRNKKDIFSLMKNHTKINPKKNRWKRKRIRTPQKMSYFAIQLLQCIVTVGCSRRENKKRLAVAEKKKRE